MESTPRSPFVGRFGERVAWRRQQVRLTQAALAAKLELHRTHVTQIEKGQYLSMKLELLAALARELRTSSDFLLGLSDDPGEMTPPGPCPGQEDQVDALPLALHAQAL